MNIGFDVISDLNLSPEDSFNWEGKVTSLYCVIAGNISNDMRAVRQTLLHLSKLYQGIFYIIGTLEYETATDIQQRSDEIFKLCATIKNVAVLHHHVVIIDGIAVVGANGWYDAKHHGSTELELEAHRHEDLSYLKSTLERLQTHLDVKKIFVVSHSVPGPSLYFGEAPDSIQTQLSLDLLLGVDTEKKITHWAYGTYGKVVDTTINGINYINNSSYKRKPYWAKRVEISI